MQATQVQWLRIAATQLQQKRGILEEVVEAQAPPNIQHSAQHLVFLCEVLLAQSVARYLKTL